VKGHLASLNLLGGYRTGRVEVEIDTGETESMAEETFSISAGRRTSGVKKKGGDRLKEVTDSHGG